MTDHATEILVVGGGHAGVEAASAAARLGCATTLVTLAADDVGALSCNPAVGGLGKGQLVREVDALGGVLGEIADAACIHYRLLNAGRGAAVRSTRMQVDMDVFKLATLARVQAMTNLTVIADEVLDLQIEHGRVTGALLERSGTVRAAAVVISGGTFFHGLIHIGPEHFSGGRLGGTSSERLPQRLAELGLRFGRFKTGTTPRLDGRTIDFSKLQEQAPEPAYRPFSRRSPPRPVLAQRSCHIGRTTTRTHEIIRNNLHRSALYSGIITATGVRYCPSVEDKVVKFPDRDSHHVFVEPEGLATTRYYPNGLSNSLPASVQDELVHSIAGLEDARIVQYGYGIEHDYLDPTQLGPGLECKVCAGLFFAGQINGTTGYEEAAVQGLLAGVNAVRGLRRQEPVILERSQAYAGVLIDDLVTKGTNEPYRMFTSRVEYRLVIREDNTDERLLPLGYRLGLVGESAYQALQLELDGLARERQRLRETVLSARDLPPAQFAAWNSPAPSEPMSLEELLRRPEISYAQLAVLDPSSARVPAEISLRAEILIKYDGYIRRQAAEIDACRHLEKIRIPAGFVYSGLPGLSREIVEKLGAIQPLTLGQASRVSGVTPAAVTLLLLQIRKNPTVPAKPAAD